MSYLAHLYPHLRIHQVFGANTDVGKTIFTTALALASASLPYSGPYQEAAKDKLGFPTPHKHGELVHYVKPVSTGSLEVADSV
jgi:dethiobiotin synthetase/adenosylmethionine--8-amino-7-oxononanoate aminotransferase